MKKHSLFLFEKQRTKTALIYYTPLQLLIATKIASFLFGRPSDFPNSLPRTASRPWTPERNDEKEEVRMRTRERRITKFVG